MSVKVDGELIGRGISMSSGKMSVSSCCNGGFSEVVKHVEELGWTGALSLPVCERVAGGSTGTDCGALDGPGCGDWSGSWCASAEFPLVRVCDVAG